MSTLRRFMTAGMIVGLVIALALILAPAKQANAQQGIVWATGFQVQNLGGSAATVTIDLYLQDSTTGTPFASISAANHAESASPIAVGANRTYYPVPVVSAPFNGSAVVKADQPIAAIVNILGNAGISGQPFYSGSASGVNTGSTTVLLPLIMRNNSSISTWFAVQNVGTAAATVTVNYKTGGVAGKDATETYTIGAGASKVLDQSTNDNIGSWFVGSATVTSSQPLAVIVNQIGKGVGKQTMLTYTGFAAESASNSVALPMIQQANGGNGVGISVQNTSSSTNAVGTIVYSTNLVPGGAPLATDSFTIPPNGSVNFLKLSTNPADRYVGSALVTTSSSTVVVMVNQVSSSGTGSSYEGGRTSTATTKVSLPLLMVNGGFYTAVQCKDVSGVGGSITLNYNANTAPNSTFNPSPFSGTIEAYGSVNITQNFPSQYVGGGVVEAPSSKVVCIVNQLKPNAGDSLLTYNGINY